MEGKLASKSIVLPVSVPSAHGFKYSTMPTFFFFKEKILWVLKVGFRSLGVQNKHFADWPIVLVQIKSHCSPVSCMPAVVLWTISILLLDFFLTYVMKPVNPHSYFSAGDETRGLTHARHAQLHPSSPSYQVWYLSSGSFCYGALLQPFLLRSSIVCLRADLSLYSREDRDRK